MKKLLLLASVFAFDNTNGWKLDEDGNLELKDGNPVYIDNSGREMTVGHDTISNLNAEAKSHREAKEAAEAKLASFKDLDPDKAREAIELMSKVDAKKLIDAGEVDKVKEEIRSQLMEQMNEKDKSLTELQDKYNNSLIDKVFDSSEFVRDSVAVPRDMFQDSFRKNFKVEDGQVVSYDKSGNRLMSKERAGEYASPEEALQILVNSHSQKDVILKADANTGSGGSTSGGTRGGGKKTITRGEFEKLPGAQQAEMAGKMRSGEITISD